MDNKSESTISKKVPSKNDKNIASKLRRLKIQESILAQDLQKTKQTVILEKPISSEIPSVSNNSDVLLKVKDSYSYVKNLFDDINTLTHSRELLADIDLSEMKDKVLEFETKLKSLKTTINLELKALKTSEQELIKQLNQEPNEIDNIKRNRKVSSAKFNDIVPSPVRALMTSPLKCVEVQELQNFMKNSGNRYGGWNEYSHNIFVKFWQKRFGINNESEIINDDFVFNEEYEMFILELLPKLQGITENDIKWHIKWYEKYLFLKAKQQKAIERWKWNKRTIKCVSVEGAEGKTENLDMIHDDLSGDRKLPEERKKIKGQKRLKSRSISFDRKVDVHEDNINKKPNSTLMKPTAQWLYRIYDDNLSQNSMKNYSVENIEKLCIPNWRLNLLT